MPAKAKYIIANKALIICNAKKRLILGIRLETKLNLPDLKLPQTSLNETLISKFLLQRSLNDVAVEDCSVLVRQLNPPRYVSLNELTPIQR